MAISRPRSANVSLQTFPMLDYWWVHAKLGDPPCLSRWSLLWRAAQEPHHPRHPARPWFLSGTQMIRHQHLAAGTWEPGS